MKNLLPRMYPALPQRQWCLMLKMTSGTNLIKKSSMIYLKSTRMQSKLSTSFFKKTITRKNNHHKQLIYSLSRSNKLSSSSQVIFHRQLIISSMISKKTILSSLFSMIPAKSCHINTYLKQLQNKIYRKFNLLSYAQISQKKIIILYNFQLLLTVMQTLTLKINSETCNSLK